MNSSDSRSVRASRLAFAGLLSASLAFAGCDDGNSGSDSGRYVLGTLVFAEETSTYVSLLDELGPQTVDLATATEVNGLGDVWVHEGDVFVANSSDKTITKYSVASGSLVEEGVISFTLYGATDFAFYQNVFVAPDKAYFLVGTTQLVVWNPKTMVISGPVDLPALAAVDGLNPFNAYFDRGAQVRDGRAYLPFYYANKPDYFTVAGESRIVVVDVATDEVVDSIVVPCPGIDHSSVGEDGTLYFSSWIFAIGGSAVLDDRAPTCVFRIPTSGGPSVLFTVKDVVGGLEGGVFTSIGDGYAYLSVLDPAHATGADQTVTSISYGNNWRYYRYEFATGTATVVDGFDWNGGAQYTFDIGGTSYMLVARGDYAETAIYDIGDGTSPVLQFTTPGWSTRLFDTK